MNVEKNEEITTTLCVKCNTFYGNETQAWLCSTCFRTQRKDSIVNETVKIQIPPSIVVQASVEKSIESESKPKQADPSRCYECNKKIGLLGVNCKCTLIFCNVHRLPESHNCTIDYRQLGKQKLSKQIQKVAPSKISYI